MRTTFTLSFILFSLISFSQIDGNQGSTRNDRTTGIERIDVRGNVKTTVVDRQLLIHSANNQVELKSFQIFDLSGKLIYSKTLTSSSTSVSLAEFSSGIYVIIIQTNTETVSRKIFI